MDELEELRDSNVDYASGDVVFIDDSRKAMEGDKTPVKTCAADAKEDMADGDYNEIEVR